MHRVQCHEQGTLGSILYVISFRLPFSRMLRTNGKKRMPIIITATYKRGEFRAKIHFLDNI